MMDKYSGSDWVERQKIPMSDFGRRVADLLGQLYQGIYHIEKAVFKTDFTNWRMVEITVRDSDLATFDTGRLTLLVLLCHAMCIRCEIEARSNWGYSRLRFTSRAGRTGDIYARHPTIEEAIEMFEPIIAAVRLEEVAPSPTPPQAGG